MKAESCWTCSGLSNRGAGGGGHMSRYSRASQLETARRLIWSFLNVKTVNLSEAMRLYGWYVNVVDIDVGAMGE
jgi:hypothetical protein